MPQPLPQLVKGKGIVDMNYTLSQTAFSGVTTLPLLVHITLSAIQSDR